jgi:hypothetical protein
MRPGAPVIKGKAMVRREIRERVPGKKRFGPDQRFQFDTDKEKKQAILQKPA